MAHAVLALGATTLTASGCVWYVPALADLRAGADRPVSRRTAAASCVTGWGATGALAVLLLLVDAWWIHGTWAAAGAATAVALRARAVVQRRRELREAARGWDRLGGGPLPADPTRSRRTVAVLVVTGLLTATAAALLATARPGTPGSWPATAGAPAAVLAVFLVIALTHAHTVRHRAAQRDPGRPG
ncbi:MULTISPECIES: hypothetical protein [unclassified Streptomyces]|uniref:hypothetical protein n=1 Tax=unclassified Streptomyces TaxID=2593676 RepID=UPI003D760CF2